MYWASRDCPWGTGCRSCGSPLCESMAPVQARPPLPRAGEWTTSCHLMEVKLMLANLGHALSMPHSCQPLGEICNPLGASECHWSHKAYVPMSLQAQTVTDSSQCIPILLPTHTHYYTIRLYGRCMKTLTCSMWIRHFDRQHISL